MSLATPIAVWRGGRASRARGASVPKATGAALPPGVGPAPSARDWHLWREACVAPICCSSQVPCACLPGSERSRGKGTGQGTLN